MIDKNSIVEQTKIAFDFIQKLNLEVSYLIKEVEAMLSEEEEKFIIGRPAGYGITARSSTGLETNNVSLWVLRRFAVCFIPEDKTKIQRGQTVTSLRDDLRILYLRFVLNGRDVTEPAVYSGVLRDIKKGPRGTAITKFEHFMGIFEYANENLFGNPENIDYEEGTMSIKGELIKVNLYDVNDSDAIRTKIVEPVLALFRDSANACIKCIIPDFCTRWTLLGRCADQVKSRLEVTSTEPRSYWSVRRPNRSSAPTLERGQSPPHPG